MTGSTPGSGGTGSERTEGQLDLFAPGRAVTDFRVPGRDAASRPAGAPGPRPATPLPPPTRDEAGSPVYLEEIAPGIAAIVFEASNGKQNILTPLALRRLEAALQTLRSATHFRAVLVGSAIPGSFVAGADVNEIAGVDDAAVGRESSRLGQAIFNDLADLPVPVIAAINGVCLGGGLELALACHYRVASDSSKVRLGLPEVRLGIVPGFGGTQRLPHLIGLPPALDLIVSGKHLDAKQAKRRGLVDAIIPVATFDRELLAFAERAAAGKPPAKGVPAFKDSDHAQLRRAHRPLRDRLLESPIARSLLFHQAKRAILENTKGHYEAPIVALETVRTGWKKTLEDGLEIEAEAVGRCVASPEKKALVHVFFLTEANRRDPGVAGVAPRAIQRAALLGAGVMGGGIAQVLSQRDITVRMKDVSEDALLRGLRAASAVYRGALKRRRLTQKEMDRRLTLIHPTLDYTGFGRVDVVFEAVVESMAVKQAVLREVEAVSEPGTIFATNTSALSIAELARVSKRPETVAGFHFFNPVDRMPLVEVIRARATNDETIATLMALARRLGKTPILCQDAPGFLVNRILGRYLNEACHLLADGVAIDACDRVALDFGMPMGPLRLIDEIGADVAAKVAATLLERLGPRYQMNNLVERMVGENRLGRKTGRGFYQHDAQANEDAQIGASSSKRGPRARWKRPHADRVDARVRSLIETGGQHFRGSEEEIQNRLFLVMIDEAARCLEENVVREAGDVDIGMIFGAGFPPFRGGLLHFADTRGVRQVTDTLTRLSETVSPRFTPCQRLKEMAARGWKFNG